MDVLFVLSFLDGSRKTLKHPVEFSCLSSTDTPAESLKAVFIVNDPETWKQEVESVTVRVGAQNLFRGGCDRQIIRLSQKGCHLTIWARSLAAALLDNEAIPQEYHNISVNEVFEKHIRPYGFQNDLGVTGRLASYRVPKGISEWEAFSRFCSRAVGRTPYVAGNRVRFFTQGNGNKVITPKLYPVKQVSYTIRRTETISQVLIRDKSGQYRTSVSNPTAQKFHIVRRRALIPSPEWAQPTINAALQMKKSMAHRTASEIILSQVLDWEIGSDIVLSIPGFYLRGNIMEREIGFNQQGEYTKLTIE